MNDKTVTTDKLAQEIRRVDGNHSLGAAALAEALMPFLAEHDAQPAQAAQPVAYYSREYGRFYNAGEIASTLLNQDLIAKGELIPLYKQTPAQPSADAEDAARYRWLRVHVFDDDNWGQGECNTPSEVDACIDAARAAEGDA